MSSSPQTWLTLGGLSLMTGSSIILFLLACGPWNIFLLGVSGEVVTGERKGQPSPPPPRSLPYSNLLQGDPEDDDHDLDLLIPDDDLLGEEHPTEKRGLQDILNVLIGRYVDKMKRLKEPRMLYQFDFLDENKIMELCGTSSSIKCGGQVLDLLGNELGGGTVRVRCKIRKEFLDCIDSNRETCRREAVAGILPFLPSKSQIQKIQERVWRSLWTSGGCVLAT